MERMGPAVAKFNRQRLAERAEHFLQAIPPKMKSYAVDQRFYLALAKGNPGAMQEALTELTSPKVNEVRRNRLDFAFSDPFIATLATMYAKIAWRHGFRIEVETPLIPKEWLPVTPLNNYEDAYPFMREYETGTATTA
jgi:hypothetical protein